MLSFSIFLLISCSLLRARKSYKLKYIVVSSAYIRNDSLLLDFTMPFINTLKNKGPKIDPQRIPVLTSNKSDLQFLNCTYW